MGLMNKIIETLQENMKADEQQATLDETLVERRYHKQRQYISELEAYADALSARMYQLENENAALREELRNLNVTHSIDEMIDFFREEGKRESKEASESNPFATMLTQMRKNDSSTNSDESSEGVADNMINPDEYATADGHRILDIIVQARNSAINASNPNK